jgi:hypothetical protein
MYMYYKKPNTRLSDDPRYKRTVVKAVTTVITIIAFMEVLPLQRSPEQQLTSQLLLPMHPALQSI